MRYAYYAFVDLLRTFLKRIEIEHKLDYEVTFSFDCDEQEVWKGVLKYDKEIRHLGYYHSYDQAKQACVIESDKLINELLGKRVLNRI